MSVARVISTQAGKFPLTIPSLSLESRRSKPRFSIQPKLTQKMARPFLYLSLKKHSLGDRHTVRQKQVQLTNYCSFYFLEEYLVIPSSKHCLASYGKPDAVLKSHAPCENEGQQECSFLLAWACGASDKSYQSRSKTLKIGSTSSLQSSVSCVSAKSLRVR